jgi:hypothetical protein
VTSAYASIGNSRGAASEDRTEISADPVPLAEISMVTRACVPTVTSRNQKSMPP